MIRLSPKALRFAEKAASLAERRSLAGRPDAIRGAWATGSDMPPVGTPATSQYAEITDRAGAAYLDALDKTIPMLEMAGDLDPDIGNDLAFLSAIRAELQSKLRQLVKSKAN
jgi:hypothetical protein